MDFEWDPAESASNLNEHGIDFPGAVRVFDGPTLLVESEPADEIRWTAVGEVEGVGLAVVFTIRNGRYRIISARRERRKSEENEENIVRFSRGEIPVSRTDWGKLREVPER